MMKLAILLFVGVIARQAYGDEPEPIVGGSNAATGQFPHQISLRVRGSHICGGSIVSPRHVVTAAHCVDNRSQHPYMTVVTGALWTNRQDGQTHNIKSIRIHPGYTGQMSNGWKDDIALITLTAPMTFSNVQKSIALASRDYATGGYRGVISGWGKTSVNSGVAAYLQWTGVGVLSQSACLAAHPNRRDGGAFTNPHQICTLERRGIGACQGDSGGPLVINGELCGVTSWVAPCALGIADVFTNVYYYKQFIQESMSW